MVSPCHALFHGGREDSARTAATASCEYIGHDPYADSARTVRGPDMLLGAAAVMAGNVHLDASRDVASKLLVLHSNPVGHPVGLLQPGRELPHRLLERPVGVLHPLLQGVGPLLQGASSLTVTCMTQRSSVAIKGNHKQAVTGPFKATLLRTSFYRWPKETESARATSCTVTP